ncbi:MAG TPA: tRNA pseudouridine(55) synthase TruB [Pyrinomonadaceae bacterium]
MDGILVIDKPVGVTSHDVVAQARKILRVRRIGHTGTLDPFATGVLVLLVGRATRLAQFFGDHEKEYEAIIRVGYATDTGDVTGKPLEETRQAVKLRESEIEPVLEGLRGNIFQVPPMYSAKKKGGRKLYELAREGVEVERAPLPVCIHELESIKRDGALIKDNLDGTADLKVRVVCSAGTYVRTLAEDFGRRLGAAAHLAELRRTRAGDFSEAAATTLEQLKQTVAEGALGTIFVPPAAALSRLPFVHLNANDVGRARHGLEVRGRKGVWPHGSWIKMLDEQGKLVAVASFDEEKQLLQPRVVLVDEK